ncbi:hypothetical protein BD408DRAFT_440602 [Parasitella parasitica]|nr:hypothetical protein BD408DRAFT_440602 [Parasitella parasitica]
MGLLSTSPPSATRQHQTFIEDWLFTTSNQHNFEHVNNEQEDDAVDALDADSSDSPPWASSCKPNSYWHSSRKSVVIQQEKAAAVSKAFYTKQEETEKHDDFSQFSAIDYSITATTNPIIPQPDGGDEEEEEEITAEYKTASTTLQEHDEIEELCRPHSAPCFNQPFEADSQDTIPYLADEVDDGDTQPYNADDEDQDTRPYYPDEEDQDTEAYDPDDAEEVPPQNIGTLPYSQKAATDRLEEIPYEIPKDDFALVLDMPDYIDDSDYISPLTSVNDAGDNDQNNAEYDISSPPMSLPSEKEEDVQEDFDDLTENDILQLEQQAAIKIKSTRKGKRRAASPVPVALESQIVKLDKKQIRTSVVKKPTTIDDYFLHSSAINSQTGQDIGKESSTASFTLSSNEDMNKSQVDTRRRPRFGLSKKRSS